MGVALSTGLSAQQFWDGSDTTSGNGAPLGGNGTWNTATANWTSNAAGTNNQAWASGSGTFGASAGTVEIDGSPSTTGLTFSTDGYSLIDSGGAAGIIKLDGLVNAGPVNNLTPFQVTSSSHTTTISATLGNGIGNGIQKIGSGTLILSGTNTFTGSTSVNQGTLVLGNASGLGSGANLNVGGGTLDLGGFTITKNSMIIQNGTILNGAVNQANSTQVQNANINAVLTGVGGITSIGNGTSIVSATNTFTGVTNVARGNLDITGSIASLVVNISDINNNGSTLRSAGNALSDTAAITLSNRGVLELAGSETIGSLTSGSATSELILDTHTLTTGDGTDTVFAGLISSSGGSLAKVGSGTFTLSGGDAGTPSVIGSVIANVGTIVFDGARVDLNSAGTSNSDAPLRTSGGNVTVQNGANIQMGHGYLDDGTITITGSATLMNATNWRVSDFAGESAVILVEDGAALDLTNNLIAGDDGDADLTVQTGASLTADSVIFGRDDTSTSSGLVSGTGSVLATSTLGLGGQETNNGGVGTLSVENEGTVTVTGETSFWTAACTLTVDGGTFTTGQLTEQFAITGPIRISDPVGDIALTIGDNDGDSALTAVIEDATAGPGSLKKVGAGTLTLTGSNTYSGGTVIAGGTLKISSDAGLGANGAPVTFEGGVLDYPDVTNGAARMFATTASGDARFQVDNGFGNLLGGTSITGPGALVKTGSATLNVQAACSYGGSTDVLEGTLDLSGSDERLPNTSALTLAPSTKMRFFGANHTETIGSLAGSGIAYFGSATQHLIVGADHTDSSFSGSISPILGGDGRLTKTGNGTLTLSGSSTFALGTTISSGTLLVNNGSGSGTGPGTVQVDNGAILGGTGSMAGSVTVATGAALAPGASTGTLTTGANLTLNGTYQCEINGASADKLAIAGALDITTGTLDLDLLASGTTQAVYIIASYGSLSGSQFATVIDLPGDYTIDYSYDDGGSSNNIALVRNPTSFETWAQARGLTPGVNDDFNDDPNKDGRPNIEHFALDTDPLGGGGDEGKTSIILINEGGADYFSYTIPVRTGAVFGGNPPTSNAIDGIIYQVNGNNDLGNGVWGLPIAELTPTLDAGLPSLGDYDGVLGADWEYRTFRTLDAISVLPAAFMRIDITEAP